MYKRKFPKTVVENAPSQLHKRSTISSLDGSTPSMSFTSHNTNTDDDESLESPSMLEDFNHFPVENIVKTVDHCVDDETDCSEPLFNDNNDVHSYLKQTLISCGLHLKCDQNILCKSTTKHI